MRTSGAVLFLVLGSSTGCSSQPAAQGAGAAGGAAAHPDAGPDATANGGGGVGGAGAGTGGAGMGGAGTGGTLSDGGHQPDGSGSDGGAPGDLPLDPSGNTIPDTNYPMPSGAIYMSPMGKDTNPGTLAAPVATLGKAFSLVPSGGTVVVRGGTYRDGSTTAAGKPVTLQAYPHESAWFDGTDVIQASSWKSDGNGHWSMPWSTPSFCAGGYYKFSPEAQPTDNTGPCCHSDMCGDAMNPANGDPQMVFIDGAYVHQVTTLGAATPGNFFYDWANKVIWIASDPTQHMVELASRPQAVNLTSDGSKILGLGFRRYASNEYSNETSSAVVVGGTAVVDSCVFTKMAAQGLYAGATGSTVKGSVFAANGFNGMGSNGHEHSTMAPDGLVIEGNVFNDNNTERFGTSCNQSCAQAGVKIAHMDGFTVKGNVFENNFDANGFWCDLDCTKGVIVNNLARNNGRAGIMYEVSDTGLIASNVAYGNTEYGIRSCSANTKIYNNTVVDNGTAGIFIYDDKRIPDGGQTDLGPNTANVELVNNVVSGKSDCVLAQSQSGSNGNTEPSQFFSQWDYQAYFRAGGSTQAIVNWQPANAAATSYTSLATFTKAQGYDAHGFDDSSGTDPFFVDAANKDYRIRMGSAVYRKGGPLAADVAAALGVSTTTLVSPGALAWPTGP